jgi:hypothetical protein
MSNITTTATDIIFFLGLRVKKIKVIILVSHVPSSELFVPVDVLLFSFYNTDIEGEQH